MTYWGLNAVFLAIVAVVVLVGLATRRTPRWAAVGIAAVVLLVFTAVFDNVMISIGLVDYNPQLISGVFIGVAPIEDFAYALAAVVGLPSLWALLGPAAARTKSGPDA
jgi:lycopene cyclase domain-containing protein